MPRLRTFALIGSFFVALPAVAPAQELGPTSVYDLSRALRDSGQADLALEYLGSLVAKLPKDQQPDLMLERAKTRLEVANQETAEAKRDDLIATAKKELEEFLKTSANHPRAAEANISLARVATLQGKQQLSRASKAEAETPEGTPALQKAQRALARPMFEASAKQYAAAAKKLEEQVNAAKAPSTRRELTTNLYQALLDEATNQYYLGDSYGKTTVQAEGIARQNAYRTAREHFAALAKRDENHPLCWVAKAWEAECSRPMQELSKADKMNEDIKAAYLKAPTGAVAAGYRMSRFFTIRDKWLEADGKGATPAAFQLVRKLADEWQKDYRSAKLTTEHYAVMYYVATSNYDEARLAFKYDEKTKVTTFPDSARALLARAERDFRLLTQTGNDYDKRAAKERHAIIRLLVGDGTKAPASIATFDECHMTMMVAMEKLNIFLKEPLPDESDEKATKEYKKKKDTLFGRVIALLNREKELPVPKESAREAANSQITLIFIYRQAGRTYEAAVMAEALARSSRVPATIAKAGQNAVNAYLEASFKAEDDESKAVDQARALKIATFLDTAAPEEPATEETRLTQARLLAQAKRYLEAFEVLTRVTLASPSLVEARLFQGGIAYEKLLRPNSPDAAPEAQKDSIRARAIADLSRVPPPSKPDDSLRFVRLKLQLAQLYLTGPATGYPAAEKVVVDTIALIPALPGLKDEDKVEWKMRAEIILIDTVYGQAMPMFNAGQYKECSERFIDMLVAIAQSGPAVNTKMPNGDPLPNVVALTAGRLDALRLEKLIMPSLSARARLGEIESCTELLDLARRFGGDLSKSVTAAYQVIEQARFKLDNLRAENKTDDANALIAKVTVMVNKLLEEKNLTHANKYNIAKACKDIGQYPKAIELLQQIPRPKNLDPKQPERPLDTDSADVQMVKRAALEAYSEEMKAVNLYKLSVLELGRVYRTAGMIPQGDALYDDILGKADADKTKHRKGGWAASSTEFRREFFAFTETKAAATADEKAALVLWKEAIANWSGLLGEYASVLTRPAPANSTPEAIANLDATKKRLRPIYYDVQFEVLRCTVAANVALYAKKPETLNTAMGTQGKKIAEIETKNPEIPNNVRARYRALLAANPGLEASYKAADGKGFPDRPEATEPVTQN